MPGKETDIVTMKRNVRYFRLTSPTAKPPTRPGETELLESRYYVHMQYLVKRLASESNLTFKVQHINSTFTFTLTEPEEE